jgi:hypothetical protein
MRRLSARACRASERRGHSVADDDVSWRRITCTPDRTRGGRWRRRPALCLDAKLPRPMAPRADRAGGFCGGETIVDDDLRDVARCSRRDLERLSARATGRAISASSTSRTKAVFRSGTARPGERKHGCLEAAARRLGRRLPTGSPRSSVGDGPQAIARPTPRGTQQRHPPSQPTYLVGRS